MDQIKAHYNHYNQSAMIMAQGDIQKSDYILDTTWYQFLARKDSMQKYSEWLKKEMDSAKQK